MAFDLKLDAKHDLSLGSRGLSLIDGNARIAQQIKVTLLTFLGEYFLDDTFGVPYFESVLIKSPKRVEIESILRTKIAAVPGVKAVRSIQIEIDSQTRQARFLVPDIETVEGSVTVEVTQGELRNG